MGDLPTKSNYKEEQIFHLDENEFGSWSIKDRITLTCYPNEIRFNISISALKSDKKKPPVSGGLFMKILND